RPPPRDRPGAGRRRQHRRHQRADRPQGAGRGSPAGGDRGRHGHAAGDDQKPAAPHPQDTMCISGAGGRIMNEPRYLPPDVTDEEVAMLDVDLDRAWHGVMGEVWSEPVPIVERGARRALRSAALARVLVVSPLLILAWI